MTIPVPSDSIIISKVELQELKQQKLTGVYWSMKDLEKRVNRKSVGIKNNILYPPKVRKTMDVSSGGSVFYSKSQGQTLSFKATEIAEFLENHFSEIFHG